MVRGTYVPVLVSPDAQLKHLLPGRHGFDSALIEVADSFLDESSIIWDVGANVGVFSFAAAAIATKGRIVALEPDIWLASLMRRTLAMRAHRASPVTVVPAAVGSTVSIQPFLIAKRGRASNALKDASGRSQMGGVREECYVPTVTLDTLLNTFAPPTFVKLDVEGAELMALSGGTELLSTIRPLLYVETGPNPTPVINYLERFRYSPRAEAFSNVPAPTAYNMLFVPS